VDEDTLKLRIHFASGATVDTFVTDSAVDMDAEDYVEQAVVGAGNAPVDGHRPTPGKPRWTWIGDVLVYTQGLSGVEIL
jgi:hypothetical protein